MKVKLKEGYDFCFYDGKIDLYPTSVKNSLLIINNKIINTIGDGYKYELESVYLKLSIFQFIKWWIINRSVR